MADPKRTHALIVGVERYRAGSSWTLKGPAEDARLFSKWLRDRGVPDNQIDLILAVDEVSPGQKEIGEALDRLHQKEGDLLLFFWAGHGVLGTDETRRLFYPDATLDNKKNLDLNDLLSSLRSTYFAGFPAQICIVDACANHVEDMQLAYKLPREELTKGDPRFPEPEQFVLFAGRAGEVAKNLAEGRGQFSKVVLEEVTGDANWPPDMDALQKRVWQKFEDLRLQGKSSQTPIYRWHRDWTGSQQKVADQLALQTASRERYARVGRKERSEVVAEAEGLLGILDLKALYRDWHRGHEEEPRTLEEILFRLAELPQQAGGAFPEPLLEFVERLALKVEAAEPAVAVRLRSWVDRRAPALDVSPASVAELRKRLGGKPLAQEAHVLVEVAPDLHDPSLFSLRAWCCVQEQCQPIDLPPEDPDPRPRSSEEVEMILRDFLAELPAYAPEGAHLSLELFLPRPLLCWDIDQWLVESGPGRKTPAGMEYRLAVRWRDRTKFKIAGAHWTRKWSHFRAGDLPLENSEWLCARPVDLDSFYTDLSQNDWYCLPLAFSPPGSPEAEDVLETLLGAGVPISLWLRRAGEDPQQTKLDILNALHGKRVSELPEAVREARRQAYRTRKEKDHVGHHLTLLWDDADRKLPGARKLAPPRPEGGRP